MDTPGSVRGPSLFNLCTPPTQYHLHSIMIICLHKKTENILTQGVFLSPQHPAQGPACCKPLIKILTKEHLDKRNLSPKQIRSIESWNLSVERRLIPSNIFILQMNTWTQNAHLIVEPGHSRPRVGAMTTPHPRSGGPRHTPGSILPKGWRGRHLYTLHLHEGRNPQRLPPAPLRSSWDKPHLIMVFDPFSLLLDSVC